MDAWIELAREAAIRYRTKPEDYPHLTAEERERCATELEDCAARLARIGRDERQGPAWFDFEGGNGDGSSN